MEANVFALRSRTDDEDIGVHFDNIVFVANLQLDARLAGDDRFIEIRKRKPEHRTLTTIDNKVSQYRAEVADLREKAHQEISGQQLNARPKRKATRRNANSRICKRRSPTCKRQGPRTFPRNSQVQIAQAMGQVKNAVEQQRMKNEQEKLERDHQRDLEVLDRKLNADVRSEQNWYKLLAVLLPPIPLFIVAVFVFFSRRAQEREGVARSRLR